MAMMRCWRDGWNRVKVCGCKMNWAAAAASNLCRAKACPEFVDYVKMGKFRYVTFGKCYVTAKSFFDVANIFRERIFV